MSRRQAFHDARMSASDFAATFSPSEYGESWEDVAHSEDFHHPVEGAPSHEELTADVRERGVTDPVQVYRGHVVDGHHRVAAALAAGADVPYEHAPSEMYEGQIRD